MNVKGILIEGTDGHEYLLGFRARPPGQTAAPTLSRRQADGTFALLDNETTWEASKVASAHLGIVRSAPHLIGPGTGKDLFLWAAFTEALKAFPAPPTWPTWSPSA